MAKVKKAGVVRKKGRVVSRKAKDAPSVACATFEVRPLNPQSICGHGTSVQQLFRVEESLEGKRRVHLVFFDRHGWYCEHGPNCPAVPPARKASTLGDGARPLGRTSKR